MLEFLSHDFIFTAPHTHHESLQRYLASAMHNPFNNTNHKTDRDNSIHCDNRHYFLEIFPQTVLWQGFVKVMHCHKET